MLAWGGSRKGNIYLSRMGRSWPGALHKLSCPLAAQSTRYKPKAAAVGPAQALGSKRTTVDVCKIRPGLNVGTKYSCPCSPLSCRKKWSQSLKGGNGWQPPPSSSSAEQPWRACSHPREVQAGSGSWSLPSRLWEGP